MLALKKKKHLIEQKSVESKTKVQSVRCTLVYNLALKQNTWTKSHKPVPHILSHTKNHILL